MFGQIYIAGFVGSKDKQLQTTILVLAVLLVLFVYVSKGESCTSENAFQSEKDSQTTETCSNKIENQVIELAIFFDKEFAQNFNSDPKEIQKFWEVVLLDVHRRFQTLPNVHVSFRVILLMEIELELNGNAGYTRMVQHNGKTWGANENLFPLIQSFAYGFMGYTPSFHIAVLALGHSNVGFNFIPDKFSQSSICHAKNSKEKKWMATTIISIGEFPNPAEIFAMRIASIMGAPAEDLFADCDCRSNFCGTMQKRMIPMSKYFSTCVDAHISQQLAKLHSEDMFCLNASTANGNPIIDSAKLVQNLDMVHAYTIAEQCKLFRNYIQTDDLVNEYSPIECIHAVCLDKATSVILFDFAPLEGTRCGKRNKGGSLHRDFTALMPWCQFRRRLVSWLQKGKHFRLLVSILSNSRENLIH